MDEESNLEIVPLKSRLSLNQQKSVERAPQSASSIEADVAGNETPGLLQQAAASIVFHYLGWYFPRYLLSHDTSIESKEAPYQQTAAGDVILNPLLSQPFVYPPTVASRGLHATGIWIPLVLIISAAFVAHPRGRSRWHDLHAGCCGLLTAVGLSEGATVLLKIYVQRRRPNFYNLCVFDKALLKCTGTIEQIRESQLSFPSGHSSLANCGMTFLVWFFLGKVLSNRNRVTRRSMAILVCVLPWSWAFFVGASRLHDHWHHPSDVLAGLILGGLSATIVYHGWYPPIWSQDVGRPWSMVFVHESTKLSSFDD